MEGGSLTDEYGEKKEVYKIYGVANCGNPFSIFALHNQYSVSFVRILHAKRVLTVPDVCRDKNRGGEKFILSGSSFLNGS